MRITKSSFRALLVAAVAFGILGVVVTFATEPSLPAPLAEYLRAQSEAELTARDLAFLALGIPLLIAAGVSVVGLFFFWRPARPLAVTTSVVGELLMPLTGPTVASGWAVMPDDFNLLLTGAVLALAYCSPAREWFEKAAPAAELPTGDLRSRWSG